MPFYKAIVQTHWITVGNSSHHNSKKTLQRCKKHKGPSMLIKAEALGLCSVANRLQKGNMTPVYKMDRWNGHRELCFPMY